MAAAVSVLWTVNELCISAFLPLAFFGERPGSLLEVLGEIELQGRGLGTVNLTCPSGLRWLTGADNRVE